MFYKKKGFPEVGEIVLCTVKKVLYHSVFVDLDEYENKEGMIHISEVSPGRIRTLGDYVKEGKKIVCKVLNVGKEEGHIDLSLRRVSISERIAKNNEYKQEQKIEKLLGNVAEKFKKDLKWVYNNFGYKIIEKYGGFSAFLQDVLASGKDLLRDVGMPKDFADIFYELIKEKIKTKEVRVSGNLILKSFLPDGIDIIKRVLTNAEKSGINLSYIGTPRYRITVIGNDYKDAEEKLKNVVDGILNEMKKHGEGGFSRD